MNGVNGISVGVLSIPYVFPQLGTAPLSFGPPRTAHGEVEVHLDACQGELVASACPGAVGHAGVTPLRTGFENVSGVHDLCLKMVRPLVNPLWSLDWVQLEPAGEKR